MPGPDQTQDINDDIATAIRETLAKRRMSRAELAAQARISLSSLEKALSGHRPFTQQTLVRVEDVLGMRFRPQAEREAAHAPDSLGSYSRAAVKWIEGEYLTLRPLNTETPGIYAYRTEIAWQDQGAHLVFRESDRLDQAYTQAGTVAVPHQSGHIYLVTNSHGQHRLAILCRPTIKGELFGLLTTLHKGRGAQLTPVSMPIALIPIAALEAPVAIGRIAPGHARHAAYRACLDSILAEEFALLFRPQAG